MKRFQSCFSILVLLCSFVAHAGPAEAPMAVWVNEAIVSTYSFSGQYFLDDQKQIAQYFTSKAWIDFSKAQAKLSEEIKKNNYTVTAVATSPPKLTQIDASNWRAVMNLLVNFQNPAYHQQQHLQITMTFAKASGGQGVRGYAITSLQALPAEAPCKCG